jgi:hypothetical protein
MLVKR